MDLYDFRKDVSDEVATILASDFTIDVTNTQTVPHSSDGAITFPNLDQKSQGTKLLETTVLYVDMRRSTLLSLQHRRHIVAKLYSAFVRAMTRCAGYFGGEVRGIIGDRVMILFDSTNCFTAAVDTAFLINSVCQAILNERFTYNEVTFGIGIDYGRMLATKTGIRRHGAAQQSYRSLVWLGRPANIASKLTDAANKPEESLDLVRVRVAYLRDGRIVYFDEAPHEFVRKFYHVALTGMMVPYDPTFHSFSTVTERVVTKEATPPILMTKRVYDGFRKARPNAAGLANGWLKPVTVKIPGYDEPAFGGDIVFTAVTCGVA